MTEMMKMNGRMAGLFSLLHNLGKGKRDSEAENHRGNTATLVSTLATTCVPITWTSM